VFSRLPHYFFQFSQAVYCKPWLSFTGLLILSFLLIAPIQHLRIDVSLLNVLHDNDEHKQSYLSFRDQFGHDEAILILVPLAQSSTISTQALNNISRLHKVLEANTPYLQDIKSLHNARFTSSINGDLVVEELLAEHFAEQGNIEQIKYIFKTTPSYQYRYLSNQNQFSAIIIELDDFIYQNGVRKAISATETSVAIKAIEKALQNFVSMQVIIAGTPYVESVFADITKADAQKAVVLRIIGVIIVLALFFRRLSGVILPLLIINLSVLGSLGFMGLTHSAFNALSNVIIPLLFAVATCDAIHILAVFYQKLNQYGDKQRAICEAIAHSAPAILLTSLTTGVALMSFYFAELASIAELGFITVIGVSLAFVYTIVLLPVCIAILPFKKQPKAQLQAEHLKVEKQQLTDLLDKISFFSVKHSNVIVLVSLAIFFMSLLSIPYLRYSQDDVAYFPEHHEVKQSIAFVDKHFAGANSLELLIHTQKPYDIYAPEFLHKLENFERRLLSNPLQSITINNTSSILDIIKESNRALFNNEEEAYRIPDSQALIAQELLLFENSGNNDLSKFLSQDYRSTRVTLSIDHIDGVDLAKFIDKLKNEAEHHFGDKIKIEITGNTSLKAFTIPKVLNSMTLSYILAFSLIALLMISLAANINIGLASMLPNLLPITSMLSIMAILDIPLDQTSMMIFTIAIGIVVDDTLHFIYQYKKYSEQGYSNQLAIRHTLNTTGRAIFITSCLLFIAFFANSVATLSNVVCFGLLISFVAIAALLADFFVAPALMTVIRRFELQRGIKDTEQREYNCKYGLAK